MQELTPAQHAVLEQLSRVHESVQVHTIRDDVKDCVLMIPHTTCQACEGTGLIRDAPMVIVTTDGVSAPLGHLT
jgi:excinuclease UvrABC ATPase subunit